MISSLAWLPRGVAKAVPELAQPSGTRPRPCRRRVFVCSDERAASAQKKSSPLRRRAHTKCWDRTRRRRRTTMTTTTTAGLLKAPLQTTKRPTRRAQ